KNHGYVKTFLSKNIEYLWNYLRYLKNRNTKKSEESKIIMGMIKKAWQNTKSGYVSPNKPWRY
ncbi:MAG: hypothetical protein KA157_10580, partial [Aliarcobacter sp.]|nr:hypothetical protein [Aliarcobacter sp.]